MHVKFGAPTGIVFICCCFIHLSLLASLMSSRPSPAPGLQMERLTPDGMFSMDMVVHWKGQDVAVEVNGPQHYAQMEEIRPVGFGESIDPGTHSIASPELRPMGYKMLRDRLLAARGFPVANVSWIDWERVSGKPGDVRRLLTELLNTAVEGRQKQGKGGRGGKRGHCRAGR